MTTRLCSTLCVLLLCGFSNGLTPSSACAQPPAAAPGAAVDRAWSMLTENMAAGKGARERIQALAALGSIGANPHAARLIGEAITGKDMDVRTAAVLAAGQSKNPELVPALQQALDDDEPQVAFAAAMTLWKMQDDSGEDLLLAVAVGARKDKLGLLKKERHKASKKLHSPTAMTEMGINQASGYFLGPFGFGVKAIELAHQNGGDPGRAQAVDALAQQHSSAVRDALVDCLDDKDSDVRATAARNLGRWPGPETEKVLLSLFEDDKLAVRLSAAAGYIQATDPHAAPATNKEVPMSHDGPRPNPVM
jgi:hypothetical protein